MAALIDARQIVKVYHTGETALRALRGVSVSVERGDFVALMGPSGSGKSTFLNIIGCLDQPTSGHYLLDGIHVGILSRNELAAIRNSKIGFVFQNFNLLPRTTAAENVELPMLYRRGPALNRRKRALSALKMVGLLDHAGHRPNQLSGGQQQRVAIARALVNHPDIILADEPTGSLDSRSSIEIMMHFQKLNRIYGMTMLMVTHEPDIAAHADRIIRFLDGRVLDDRKISAPRDAAGELAAMPPVDDAPQFAPGQQQPMAVL
jgi:putative ABC transport system ATP-binding protein